MFCQIPTLNIAWTYPKFKKKYITFLKNNSNLQSLPTFHHRISLCRFDFVEKAICQCFIRFVYPHREPSLNK